MAPTRHADQVLTGLCAHVANLLIFGSQLHKVEAAVGLAQAGKADDRHANQFHPCVQHVAGRGPARAVRRAHIWRDPMCALAVTAYGGHQEFEASMTRRILGDCARTVKVMCTIIMKL
jgi:hypothetical protein